MAAETHVDDSWPDHPRVRPIHGDSRRPDRVLELAPPADPAGTPPPPAPGPCQLQHRPFHLTRFVGRETQIAEVRRLLCDGRLVTLTGAGGIGKSRLAIQVAAQPLTTISAAVFVDLAPITDGELVAVTMANALGVRYQPDQSAVAALADSIGDQPILVVLDNCEHVLDATAVLIAALSQQCPGLRLLTTSREPIGVPGEVTWRVPPLAVADEATELFTDRARLSLPDFTTDGDDGLKIVAEICERLDGLPLAIELAAVRAPTLSLGEIAAGLDDRLRLLTRGPRTAMRRQQTLRASLDWSYALLTEAERLVFQRLSIFTGDFSLEAVQAVVFDTDILRQDGLDLVTALADKSLVTCEIHRDQTRYRLLATTRDYAQEKLRKAGDAQLLAGRHRDFFTAMAVALDVPTHSGHEQRLEQAETDIENLRAAFAFSRDNVDFELALQQTSSLQPLWLGRGRQLEGLIWFDTVLADLAQRRQDIAPALYARALADRAELLARSGGVGRFEHAELALVAAEEADDRALMTKALTACGAIAVLNAAVARPYLTQAITRARASDDRATLCETLAPLAYAAITGEGDPIAAREAAEEALGLADEVSVPVASRMARWVLGFANYMQGQLDPAIEQLRAVASEAEDDHDLLIASSAMVTLSHALTYRGERSAGCDVARRAVDLAAGLGPLPAGSAHAALAVVTLASGDIDSASESSASAAQRLGVQKDLVAVNVYPQIAWARGDLIAARRWADNAVFITRGAHRARALTTRARIEMGHDEHGAAERDALEALRLANRVGAYLGVPDTLECLAALAVAAGDHLRAARMLSAAHAARDRMGSVRFAIYDAVHEAAVADIRNALGVNGFESAWQDGAVMPIADVIAPAQRRRGERRRGSIGWDSLTPAEHDVIRVLREGLPNKQIAERLFVSPRTVQTHLTHIYAKLGINSRIGIVQEAARHS